jgi:hypothetical protein
MEHLLLCNFVRPGKILNRGSAIQPFGLDKALRVTSIRPSGTIPKCVCMLPVGAMKDHRNQQPGLDRLGDDFEFMAGSKGIKMQYGGRGQRYSFHRSELIFRRIQLQRETSGVTKVRFETLRFESEAEVLQGSIRPSVQGNKKKNEDDRKRPAVSRRTGSRSRITLGRKEQDEEVVRFVLDEIESVPHLEALLLMWRSRPQKWTVEALGERLYLSGEAVEVLLADLSRRKLIAAEPESSAYSYEPGSPEKNNLITRLDETYRHQLVRISQLIHSKPSASLRDFARAFRFTKKDE